MSSPNTTGEIVCFPSNLIQVRPESRSIWEPSAISKVILSCGGTPSLSSKERGMNVNVAPESTIASTVS